MTKRILFFTLSLCFSLALQGQEICDNAIDDDGDGLIDLNDRDCDCETLINSSLISNLSFEDRTCCPRENARLDCAVGWIQASAATSDYVHTCGGYLGNTGINAVCPLPFPDGEGGVGFRDGQPQVGDNYKEYVGACLTAPMEIGKRYRLDFFVGFQDNVAGSMDFEMAIFGSRSCANLPFGNNNTSIGCPLNAGGYDLLGQQSVSGSNEWINVVFEFEATEAYTVLVLGPGCAGNPNFRLNPYFYVDRLAFAEADSFGIPLDTITGSICNDDLVLQAAQDPDYSYQWYKDGIAILGETNSSLTLGASSSGEGDYICRITNTNGCFLSTSFPLRIPPYYERDTVGICDTEFHVIGTDTLRTDGYYEVMITAGDGCDSIVQLTLNVSPTTQGSIRETICEGVSYRFIDTMLRTSGTFERTISNAAGCDSLIELILTVSPPTRGTITEEICQGGRFNFIDTVVTTSGSYQRTISNSAGCDSIVELNLTVNPPLQGFIQETICEGGMYDFVDTLLMTAGTYLRSVSNSQGCDSVVQLTLNVAPPPVGFVLDTFCEGASYDFLDTTFTTSGNYSRTVSDGFGCDSIVNLSLYAFPEAGNISLPDTIRVELGDIFDIIPGLNNQGLSEYEWTDENGVVIGDESTLSDYLATKSERLFLRALNDFDCSLLASTYLLVEKGNIRVYVPNVFSPNGDNLNDFFKHFSTAALGGIIRFSVYDRWGELVFDEREVVDVASFRGWDGIFNGENAQPGVYAYLIELEFLDESTILLAGDVTLLR